MKLRHIYAVLRGITERELIKFIHQPGRFLSALVRPFLWFAVFGVGFQDVLGTKIMEPYRVPIVYQEYVVPGLLSMIALFNGMQSSLAMVYDREMGVMKVLLTSPVPRYFLLASKLWAGALLSLLQMLAFLGIACAMGIHFEYQNVMVSLPMMLMVALMLGALGLVLSVMIKQLENFSGTMNFVIFPLFF
jgi:ABC-2 type transport system permease protein